MYTECIDTPTVVSMDTCLISRAKGSIRPGDCGTMKRVRDPLKESRFGGRMNNQLFWDIWLIWTIDILLG